MTIGNSVTSIGDSAFLECRELKTVNIKQEAKLIKDGTISYGTVDSFYGSTAGSVTIMDPDNIPTLYKDVDGNIIFFTLNTTLPNITNVENKEKIVSVEFSPNVTSIGSDAFYDCSALQSVTIPDSVKSIGSNAFQSCTALQSVTIGDSVTSIGYGAFSLCSVLQSVTIGTSVTSISEWAFSRCIALQNVTIPDSVTSIGNRVFQLCSALQSVTIPDSVTSIGIDTFRGCSALQSVTIPDSVTNIGDGAFIKCSKLESVNIPDSVTSIGTSAFYECSALQSVTIGDSVTSIGSQAFQSCTALQSVTIGDSVTSIGNYAFYDCSALQTVTIGNSVTSIGDSAFLECRELKTVNIKQEAKLIKDGTISYGTVDSFYGSTGGSVTIMDPDNIPEGPAYLTTLPENLKSMIHYTHDDPNFITISVADDFTVKQAFTEFQKYGFDELDESLFDFDWRNITNTTDIDNKLSFSKYNIKELINKLHINTGDPENSYAIHTVPFKNNKYIISIINDVLTDPNYTFIDGDVTEVSSDNTGYETFGKSIDHLNNTFQNNITIQNPNQDQDNLWKSTEKIIDGLFMNPYLNTRSEIENSDLFKEQNIPETAKGYSLLTLQYKGNEPRAIKRKKIIIRR